MKEIGQYYENALWFVKAINSLPDVKAVWEKIYEEMICPCVDLIKQGRLEYGLSDK